MTRVLIKSPLLLVSHAAQDVQSRQDDQTLDGSDDGERNSDPVDTVREVIGHVSGVSSRVTTSAGSSGSRADQSTAVLVEFTKEGAHTDVDSNGRGLDNGIVGEDVAGVIHSGGVARLDDCAGEVLVLAVRGGDVSEERLSVVAVGRDGASRAAGSVRRKNGIVQLDGTRGDHLRRKETVLFRDNSGVLHNDNSSRDLKSKDTSNENGVAQHKSLVLVLGSSSASQEGHKHHNHSSRNADLNINQTLVSLRI